MRLSLTKVRHQPNLCNVRATALTQDEECFYSAEEFSLEPCSVSCQVVGYDASVHLQISTDYLRESYMTILQVTYTG